MRYVDRSTFDATPPRQPLAAAVAALLLVAVALIGCEDRPPPPPQTGPEPTDSLVRLMRHQLTAEDPVAVEEEIMCQMVRLGHMLGEDSALKRIRQARDTAYGPGNGSLRRRVDSALALKVIGVPEDCDLPGDSTTAADSTARAPEGPDNSAADTTGTDSIKPRR